VQDIHVNEITKCVVSAGIDRRVAVWHNDVIFDTIEFNNPMNCIRFIENGKKFVAGSWTGEVYAYDLVQKVKITVKKSGKVHQNSIRSLSTGKKHFASLDITGVVSVWDQMTLDVLQSVRLSNVTTISYDFSDHLMYGLSNGIINVTAGFGEMTKVAIPDLGAVTALFCASDSGLYIGYYSGAVVKVQAQCKTYQVSSHKGRVNLISSFKITQSGKDTEYIASCSDDGTVHVSQHRSFLVVYIVC
jgi:WD40 repeat protein